MSLRDSFDERSMGLATLLFEYDLLGVYQDSNFEPDDSEEYDDLVSTIREGLKSGHTPQQLSEIFAEVLRTSYGLDLASAEHEMPFIEKVHAWWQGQQS